MLTLKDYLLNPCRAASLPYWKAMTVSVPPFMKIIHQDTFDPAVCADYSDEPYFRLYHDLKTLPHFPLPEGFSFSCAGPDVLAAYIAQYYEGGGISAADLRRYEEHPVYCAQLWLTILDEHTGAVAASGIGKLDPETGEGILEWIQVSPAFRRRGLGRCLVAELLRRMQGKADFVTVSGQCRNPYRPELLYRACGFTGNDVWHILTKR